jgi:hypothetical protein
MRAYLRKDGTNKNVSRMARAVIAKTVQKRLVFKWLGGAGNFIEISIARRGAQRRRAIKNCMKLGAVPHTAFALF